MALLDRARKLAEKECDGKYRVVAICQDSRGRVVSIASNSYKKSHPRQAHFAKLAGFERKIYLHAEVLALLRAVRKNPYRLYIVRFDRSGQTRMAAPCPVCREAIREAGIKEIEYTTGS